MLFKAVFPIACTLALCCAQGSAQSSAQTDAPPSSEAPPSAAPIVKENPTKDARSKDAGTTAAQQLQAPAVATQAPEDKPEDKPERKPEDKPADKPAVANTAPVPPSTEARPPAADGKAPAIGKTSAASADTKAAAYVIGPLDVLIVKVWNNANLSGPYDVAQDGMISMQLAGEIKADGLTARQLKESVTERLSDFINSPVVDVTVAKVNSKRFFVYGGVGRPGEYPLNQPTTVMDALSNVGGFRDFADTKKIRIQRPAADGKSAQEFKFNYKDVSNGKNMGQNISLQNGDRIFVKE